LLVRLLLLQVIKGVLKQVVQGCGACSCTAAAANAATEPLLLLLLLLLQVIKGVLKQVMQGVQRLHMHCCCCQRCC
jgi:hypothetical protein